MWVIITLASLAVMLVLVLSVPFDMAFQVSVPEKPRFRIKLLWRFGLVSKEITQKKKAEEKKKVVEKKPKPREGKRKIGVIIGILRTKGLLKQLKVFLSDIFGSLKIRDLLADFRIGLGNPAETGLLFALVGPTALWMSSSFPIQIRVQPSFADEATFEGYARGAVRLRPIRLVMPLFRLVFSLTTIRIVKKLVLTKWKRKK